MSDEIPPTGANPTVTTQTTVTATTNPWLAPDTTEPAGSTAGPVGTGWPTGPPRATTSMDPPAPAAPAEQRPLSSIPSASAAVDVADDMWWPAQTAGGATPGRSNSTRSWIIASVVAVAVTLLAIAGLNRAGAGSATTAAGPGGRNGVPGGANFPQNGGVFPGARQGGQGGQAAPNGAPIGGGPAGGIGTSGSITAVTAGGFTMTESGGLTVKVATSSSTQVIKIAVNANGAQGGVQASPADLVPGDQVTVSGNTANGTLTATFVLVTG